MQGKVESGLRGQIADTKIIVMQSGKTAVVYQNTAVVKFNDDAVDFTAMEGHRTQTTKLRMNQTSYEYGLGYYVQQQNGIWCVCTAKVVNNRLVPEMVIARFGANHRITIQRNALPAINSRFCD